MNFVKVVNDGASDCKCLGWHGLTLRFDRETDRVSLP